MPGFPGAFAETSDLARDFLQNLRAPKRPVPPRFSLSPQDGFHAEELFARMLAEFASKPLGYTDTIRAYASILITLLARTEFDARQEPEPLEGGGRFVLHCVRYVESHCAERLTLDAIARISAMSKSDFCRRFREITGYSFNRYLNLCRIRRAAEHLKKGCPAALAADLCGYRNFSTFYRNFKAATGVSPAAYKAGQKDGEQKSGAGTITDLCTFFIDEDKK